MTTTSHHHTNHLGENTHMANELDLQHIENEAKQLLETRMESVRALAHARAHVADKQAELAGAQAQDKTAFDAALQAGWTPEELRKVGLPQTTARTPTKARTNPRPRRAPSAHNAPGNAENNADPAHND